MTGCLHKDATYDMDEDDEIVFHCPDCEREIAGQTMVDFWNAWATAEQVERKARAEGLL